VLLLILAVQDARYFSSLTFLDLCDNAVPLAEAAPFPALRELRLQVRTTLPLLLLLPLRSCRSRSCLSCLCCCSCCSN